MLRLGHLVRLALALQHQVHRIVAVAPAEEPHHEVGHVAAPDAVDLVRHGPVEAEVAGPGVHVGVLVEGRGDPPLEVGVAGGHVQLAALGGVQGVDRVAVGEAGLEVHTRGVEHRRRVEGADDAVVVAAGQARLGDGLGCGGVLVGTQQPGDLVAAHGRVGEPGAHGPHGVQEQATAAGLPRLRIVGAGRQGVGEPPGDLRGQFHHHLLMAGPVGGDPDDLRLPRHSGRLGDRRRGTADGVRLHLALVEVDAGTRRFDHVARQRWELDAPLPATGHREHPVPRLRRIRRAAVAGHRHEVERHAEHVCELRREAAVAVEAVVVGAAQRPAGHLLAQQLGAERPEPQDVHDGARVPALGEHRHRHHAADLLAQPALAADGVEGLPDDVAVVAGGPGGPQLGGLGLQGPTQLAGGGDGVVALHLRVHQQSAEPVLVTRPVAADVREQLVGPGAVDGGAVVGVLGEAGDVVVERLGVGDGVSHHDEHRRGGQAVVDPALERLGVLVVEGA